MPISHAAVVAAGKHQVSADLSPDPEVVILNLQDSTYYGLNGVGARIWGLIQQPRAVKEIHGVLVEEFDVDPLVCETQLWELLEDLAGHGLIEVT